MESNLLESLLTNFRSDPSTNAHTKALGAISSLIRRHNQPGIAAFCLGNGYAALKDALGSDDAKLQRKSLNLIQYLLHNDMVDRSIATELGLPNQMMHLASCDDSGVQGAALGGLLELARDKTSGAGNPYQGKLKDVLRSRIEVISTMDADDLHAAREERLPLEGMLQQAVFSEGQGSHGGTVLPEEDTPQQPLPDVVTNDLK